MLGDKCYGDTYQIKDLDTGETLVVHVAKRADISLLMHLMAFRIFTSIVIDGGEILSAIPDRTTNRFYETKTGLSPVYKPKLVAPKPKKQLKPVCNKGQHVKKCSCVKPERNIKKRFGRKGRR